MSPQNTTPTANAKTPIPATSTPATSTTNHHATPSQIPTQIRSISRNDSNISTSSDSNKGEYSSTISTANSVTSSRGQIFKNQLTDSRHLFAATCNSNAASPIRSFQRATISSVVKTRAFDNNPMLQNLLASASPSGRNSTSNSQTPSPHSTPLFSRSRSLRMSGGPNRYQRSPSHLYSRNTSRTPDVYSYNVAGDTTSLSNVTTNTSNFQLAELTSEKVELKESLEFLECERQVLIDTTQELKDRLQDEKSQRRKEVEDLKRQLTDSIVGRVRAESQLVQWELEMNELRNKNKRLFNEHSPNEQLQLQKIETLEKNLETLGTQNTELSLLNRELTLMLTEKLKLNGNIDGSSPSSSISDHVSVVTAMAKLRLELNEKDKIIESLTKTKQQRDHQELDRTNDSHNEIDSLNKFLDQTVECMKSWPEELAGSSHVQELMKTLLRAHKADHQEDLARGLGSMHL